MENSAKLRPDRIGGPLRVLAVGAHPDDVELGWGGTLAKLAASGAAVRAVVLSRGERGVERGCNLDRMGETREALHRLGIDDVRFGDFPDTRFAERLNELIAFLETQIADFAPFRLYTMHGRDRHQDHRTVFDASRVAARSIAEVLLYETPSSGTDFAPSFFEPVDDYLPAKLDAIAAHESQRSRPYMQPDHLTALARVRGYQAGHHAGTGACEAYEIMRLVAA